MMEKESGQKKVGVQPKIQSSVKRMTAASTEKGAREG